jgi:nitroimidazol reductase NimA-like FMN-containing flavoprotein (pyridoxamine 5'-phosphate oxidase superfamily)
MNPFKLPQMNRAEINDLIGTQKICRIAMNRGDYPYLAPFRYVVKDNVLYFHFTNYGRKMELLKKEQKVWQIDNYAPDLSSYRFVSLCGTLEKVTDTTEYGSVVKIFSDTGKKDLSVKFLAAHGLSPGDGWEAFSTNKEMIFMKLVKENYRFGLKSPL